MNLIRKNVFHVLTLVLFLGLLISSWYTPDTLVWALLFLLIMINAVLFILHKPVTMISWITIVVGIMGILMSIPEMVSFGIDHLKGQTSGHRSGDHTFRPAIYFTVSALFSFLQIHRTIK